MSKVSTGSHRGPSASGVGNDVYHDVFVAGEGCVYSTTDQRDADLFAAELKARLREGKGERRRMNRPTIVCLCGSTRFKDTFAEATKRETLAGRIVLSVGCFPHADAGQAPEDLLGEDVKAMLDQLHLRKIDLADQILVLNVDHYIGSSTRNEIEYALAHGKLVRYWLGQEEWRSAGKAGKEAEE